MSFRKILLSLLLSFVFILGFFCQAEAPSFNSFRESIYKDNGDGASVYNLSIDPTGNFKDNVLSLFYPTSGGTIWIVIRNIGAGFLIVYLIRAGFLILFSADKDADHKKARLNFVYILFGAFLFFGVTWILGSALQIGSFQGTQGQYGVVNVLQNNLMLQVLSFLKAGAFFVALSMIVYYGYQIMSAYEQEDKIKAARKGVLNVVIALVFIKVIDYIYYIAQASDFKSKGAELMVSFSKVMGYVLGALFILSVFYAGTLLLSSSGNEDRWKKAKTIITTVFLVGVIIMLFLLIVHQVIADIV